MTPWAVVAIVISPLVPAAAIAAYLKPDFLVQLISGMGAIGGAAAAAVAAGAAAKSASAADHTIKLMEQARIDAERPDLTLKDCAQHFVAKYVRAGDQTFRAHTLPKPGPVFTLENSGRGIAENVCITWKIDDFDAIDLSGICTVFSEERMRVENGKVIVNLLDDPRKQESESIAKMSVDTFGPVSPNRVITPSLPGDIANAVMIMALAHTPDAASSRSQDDVYFSITAEINFTDRFRIPYCRHVVISLRGETRWTKPAVSRSDRPAGNVDISLRLTSTMY